MQIDLIIQGPFNSYSDEIIQHYRQLPWVNKIIASCWQDDSESQYANKVVRSLPLSNNGIGNRNAHITTSHKGLMEATTDYSAKLRGDQKISLKSMNVLYNRMLRDQNKILTLGFYAYLPFHPRDHSFWGPTEELVELFDIPLDHDRSEISNPHDAWPHQGFYANHTRAETYIASNYLAKKDSAVERMVNASKIYLHDYSPLWDNAKRLSEEIMPKYFSCAPKIDFEWPKHGLSSYHYAFAASHYGEFWSE